MLNAKSCLAFLILAMLVGSFSFPFVAPLLLDTVVIKNTGRTTATQLIAESGSARDIQAAVDQAVASGKTDVLIPAGTFNFVNFGEGWHEVTVPAGINIFGAPTQRTSGLSEPEYGMSPNNQVVAWNTILVVPWNMPTPTEPWPVFFHFVGSGDATKPSRISDIKMCSYRDTDSTSVQMLCGINIENVVDFRVDHCYFSNTAGKAVWVTDGANFKGVIDHCYAVNTVGYFKPYETRTLDYGFFVKPRSTISDPLDNFLGEYVLRSVYVEDCYLSRWRHCTVNDEGGHMVVRHNTFEYDFGYGSIDTHENYGRCTEIYNNKLINCIGGDPQRQAIWMRGGGGVIFGNYADDSYSDPFANLSGPQEEWWLWDNNVYNPTIDGTYYALSQKADYDPYLYPHPLAVNP